MDQAEIEAIEIELLLEALKRRYGYDFHNYAQASLKRRIERFMALAGYQRIAELIPAVMDSHELMQSLVNGFSVPVTEMFRDPHVFVTLREQVIPLLKTYPFLNIWHAGCATGEEVYSLAILLHEEGLLDRCQIFATDFNQESLAKAQEGVFSLDRIRDFTLNYQAAQGKGSFSDYYHARYNRAKMVDHLKQNITFAPHNLVTDGVFIRVQLILCRNVLIYFDKRLQNRVLGLFHDALERGGFLCLGRQESLRFTDVEEDFSCFTQKECIYRRVGGHTPSPKSP
uniref:CheR-type protein glutamate methyltransferase n=1 Tax=Magnetococcus massalia (strain MO-1) TaxID=451514 RepID=A0A1S7LLC1_MAGMO|nr:CheR-type protein glutamate methyltransferase [Candidatus Magnetococcus massalia]